MDKKNLSQLELFSQAKVPASEAAGLPSYFLSYIYKYEKAVLVIIAFIIIGIISFSLGVEKGKRLSAVKFDAHLDMAAKIKTPQPEQADIPYRNQPALKQEPPFIKVQPPLPAVTQDSAQKYTIQVATYQTNSLAKKEAETLKKRGFAALTFSKGGYTLLCVGNFSNKETARTMLSELKKRYRDCFIRRL